MDDGELLEGLDEELDDKLLEDELELDSSVASTF